MVKSTSLVRRSNQQRHPSSPEDATTPGRAEDATQQVTAPFLCPRSRRGFLSADDAAAAGAAAASVSDMAARDL
uniref:Uncharacterized protein n=1 Tax=Arundo donax TaxID=35708 RepID=A0A0A9FHH2_ARUDO